MTERKWRSSRENQTVEIPDVDFTGGLEGFYCARPGSRRRNDSSALEANPKTPPALYALGNTILATILLDTPSWSIDSGALLNRGTRQSTKRVRLVETTVLAMYRGDFTNGPSGKDYQVTM